MARFTRTQDVKAPRDKVFQQLIEVERFPAMFPDTFTRMEVVGKEGDSRLILCEEQWAGRHFAYTMKEDLTPPGMIHYLVVEGSGKGTTESIELAETPEGTRVTMTIEAKGLAAVVLGGLFKKQFEKEMNHIFEGYMKVVEASAR